ncbi:hypothetical protein FACS1894139_08960 [Planctomycetales bacterium]|nr:hypothetical protein FACS1894108_05790 [Planctomycetales bacterium]GHT05334.1 hypothetical protein FACS1894139_08960 [Planctomycetales bacterium]GHV20100.1 hypothetical protein AGMMS49959_06700 [Planctomycetales bacterium]
MASENKAVKQLAEYEKNSFLPAWKPYEKGGVEPQPRDALDYLVAVLLAENSDVGAALSALRRLKAAFMDYNEVRAARWTEVARALAPLPAVEAVARQMVDMLFRLFDDCGAMSLRYLTLKNAAEAKQRLTKLEPALSKDAVQTLVSVLVPNAAPLLSPAALALAKKRGLLGANGNAAALRKLLTDAELPPEKCGELILCLELEASAPKSQATARKTAAPKKKK